MTDGYPIGMGEAEPERVREGGRWSDIMAAPLDSDDLYRPLEFEGEETYLDTGDPEHGRGPIQYYD